MEFDKSVLVLTHSDYLITDAGVEKVIQGQQKLTTAGIDVQNLHFGTPPIIGHMIFLRL